MNTVFFWSLQILEKGFFQRDLYHALFLIMKDNIKNYLP